MHIDKLLSLEDERVLINLYHLQLDNIAIEMCLLQNIAIEMCLFQNKLSQWKLLLEEWKGKKVV